MYRMFAAACLSFAAGSAALGQSGGGFGGGGSGGGTPIPEPEPVVEWAERTERDGRLEALDFGLLGDNIDPHLGGLSFQVTDVSLPGNFDLPVALTRKITQGHLFAESAEFGDWTYDVPRLHVLMPQAAPWTGARCTNRAASFQAIQRDYGVDGTQTVYPVQYSDGLNMDIPGQGTRAVLQSRQASAAYPSGYFYTDDHWRLACGVTASDGGQGFYAYAPNGDRYRFDRYVQRTARDIWFPEYFNGTYPSGGIDPSNPDYLERVRSMLMATEVVDVHGNWVRYDYDSSGRLTAIRSSDGRRIDLAYGGGSQLVSSVTANGRTWTYQYGAGGGYGFGFIESKGSSLTSVQRPDGRSWSYDLADMSVVGGPGRPCGQGVRTLSVTHPMGVTGEFDVAPLAHRMGLSIHSPQPILCSPMPGAPSPVAPASALDHTPVNVASVLERRLSGPGMPASTWTYSYEHDVVAPRCSGNYPCINDSAGDPTNWTRVLNPDGSQTTYHHYWPSQLDGTGGRLARLEVRAAPGGAVLESQTYSYTPTHTRQGSGESRLGFLPNGFGGAPPDETRGKGNIAIPVAVYEMEITRGADTYTTRNLYRHDVAASNYTYGAAYQTHAWSSVSGGWSGRRTQVVDYQNLTSSWILSLPTRVERNGRELRTAGYDSQGQRAWINAFGVRVADFSYNADGTLAWYEDALDRRTQYASYKRGTPRSLTRPDGVSLSASIDNNGWLTAVTNGRGVTTAYSYTNMGWLSGVDRPSGFTDTTISYSGSGAGLVQTTTRGALRTVVTYDPMLRPTREERRAISNGGGSIFTRFEYDGIGRTVFQSFPSGSSNPTAGVDTEYDALSRVVRTEETVAPNATTVTAYLSDNRVRVTDPLGAITTTRRSGWGGPDDGHTIRIDHPLGLRTDMTYDAWGNLLTARQRGSHSGFSVDETQSWVYDNRLRLCRHATPQEGHRLYAYDAANQLIGEARGAASGGGCAALPGSLTVSTSYDALGRPDVIDFPDTSPDINLDYDADGNLTRAARGSAVWTYGYDAMDQLTAETLVVDGRTYAGGYTYTSDGRLSTRTTPGGRTISFAPNGHGQPRRARVAGVNYAGSAVYHASGQPISIDYANTVSLEATLNARQQVTSLRYASPAQDALDHDYTYDALGRATFIDSLIWSSPTRDHAYSYDALGRLVSASGEWGAGSYTYDLLNNLREKALGLRTVELQYNGAGRLSRYRDTDAGFTWRNQSYDSRGNVTNDGVHGFSYDRSGQPYAISGGASGSFVYDAHRRRVKQTLDGETIYSVYGLDGTLHYRDNITTGETTDYVRMGSHTVGRFDETDTFTWIHADHLGSASAATRADGTVRWREHYTPFGEPINDPAANRDEPGFTGHIRDDATGLTYAQARYYNPVIARFYAPDPVGFASGGPGYFNRYAYTANDPVNYSDAHGTCVGPALIPCVAVAARVAVAGYRAYRAVRTARAAAQISTVSGSLATLNSDSGPDVAPSDETAARIAVEPPDIEPILGEDAAEFRARAKAVCLERCIDAYSEQGGPTAWNDGANDISACTEQCVSEVEGRVEEEYFPEEDDEPEQ